MDRSKTAIIPRYETLIFETLQLEAFLEKFKGNIFEMLLKASLRVSTEEFQAFNAFFHVASSAAIKGSTNLTQALNQLRKDPDFKGCDPTTVVTMAILYFLLLRVKEHTPDPREKARIRYVQRRFEEMNWMLNPTIVKRLDFQSI